MAVRYILTGSIDKFSTFSTADAASTCVCSRRRSCPTRASKLNVLGAGIGTASPRLQALGVGCGIPLPASSSARPASISSRGAVRCSRVLYRPSNGTPEHHADKCPREQPRSINAKPRARAAPHRKGRDMRKQPERSQQPDAFRFFGSCRARDRNRPRAPETCGRPRPLEAANRVNRNRLAEGIKTASVASLQS